MKFFNEFKKFIARGNVIDMAVGIIVGTAFTKIVNSFVADVVTPAISIITGKVNLTGLKIVVSEATETTKELAITYGNFLQAVIDFLIIAFVVFVMVTAINKFHERLKKKEEEVPQEPPKPTKEEELLTEIRDLLKERE